MKDLHSTIVPSVALTPTTQSGTAVINSSAIAVSSYHSLEVLFYTGTVLANWAGSIKLQESADGNTGWADVGANDYLPSGVTPVLNASNQVLGLGYIGSQAYVRGVITPNVSGTTTTAGILAVNGNPMGNTAITNVTTEAN